MSDKIIDLTQRRQKALNLPDSGPLETKGDELAILALRPAGSAMWLNENLTREQLNYLLDLLDRARDKIRQLSVEMDS